MAGGEVMLKFCCHLKRRTGDGDDLRSSFWSQFCSTESMTLPNAAVVFAQRIALDKQWTCNTHTQDGILLILPNFLQIAQSHDSSFFCFLLARFCSTIGPQIHFLGSELRWSLSQTVRSSWRRNCFTRHDGHRILQLWQAKKLNHQWFLDKS